MHCFKYSCYLDKLGKTTKVPKVSNASRENSGTYIIEMGNDKRLILLESQMGSVQLLSGSAFVLRMREIFFVLLITIRHSERKKRRIKYRL